MEDSPNYDSVSVVEGRSNYDFNSAFFVITNSVCLQDELSFDSGCSYHMFLNRDYFTTYLRISGGIVLIGNNVACKTVGIQTIKINMYHGIIKTLVEV